MHRFIDGEDRLQQTLLPHSLEDYVGAENPVRVIEAFIDELDLAALGFAGMMPAATGRPAYHPSTLLKIYLYSYLNRVQSSRRLERETQRKIELMWLTGRLMPDFETTGGGGLLRGSDGKGGTTEICLSATDVYALARSAHLLRDQLLSQLAAGRGSVAPRVSVPAVGANLNVDLL